MREFGFELRLCAYLEGDDIIARQLGGGVHAPGSRVVDVVQVEPGPDFEERTASTSETIPDTAIEADLSVGHATSRREAFADIDIPPERQREVVDRAVEIGFVEREYRSGRELLRRATQYPSEWYDGIQAFENKPDLGSPGDLQRQLRFDVALGLFDEVILATASHVTGAHLNRIPPEVGVWQLRDGDVSVIREPQPLPVDEIGVEVLDERPLRTDVTFPLPEEKAHTRRRLAERAYGKGWRTYDLPDCREVDTLRENGAGGLPYCSFHDMLVDPAVACDVGCAGYEPVDPPAVDLDVERDAASPWIADPEGRARHQAGLDRFG